MTGIYLQGGGAKGAFQAGAIYALHELGVKFDVIASTSIGAVNGYHIFRGQYQALKSLWTDVDESQMSYVREEENIIENVVLIERLRALKPYIREVSAFYVNYVNVSECRLIETFDDISQMPLEEGLARVRYSALLPKPQGVKLSRESLESFDSKYLFERFREEVIRGEYNDMSLDGGIVNNNFLEPFIQRHVDRIILIPFQPAYEAPDYIRDKYSSSNLIVIDPIESFLPMDTLRFEPHFCRLQFEAGYQRALDVWRRHTKESK